MNMFIIVDVNGNTWCSWCLVMNVNGNVWCSCCLVMNVNGNAWCSWCLVMNVNGNPWCSWCLVMNVNGNAWCSWCLVMAQTSHRRTTDASPMLLVRYQFKKWPTRRPTIGWQSANCRSTVGWQSTNALADASVGSDSLPLPVILGATDVW